MRKTVLIIAILGLIGTSTGFPLEIEAENRINNLEEPATYELKVKNTMEENRTFKTSVANVERSWWFYDNSFQKLRPNETTRLKFNVNATPRTVSGRHNFTVQVKTNSGEKNTTSDYFILKKNKNIFFSDTNLQEDRSKLLVSSRILNTAQDRIKRLKISIRGSKKINRTSKLSIDSGEEKEIQKSIDKPKKTGEYTISLIARGEKSDSLSYDVEETGKQVKTQGISINKTWDRNLLTSTRTISAKNKGSETNTATISQSLPIFLSPITDLEPKPQRSSISGGEKNLKWEISLKPGEQESISYSTSYKMPLAVLFILLLMFGGIKTLEKETKIEKEVKNTEEGLQITLHVDNHSSSRIEHLEIEDFLPSVLEIDDFKVNEPVVAKTENGTRLEWELDDMEAGESRALVYTAKKNYEGKSEIHLPEAEMKSEETGTIKSDSVIVESL